MKDIKITFWQSSATRHTYQTSGIVAFSIKQLAFRISKAHGVSYADALKFVKNAPMTHDRKRDWYLRNKEKQDRLADICDDLGTSNLAKAYARL